MEKHSQIENSFLYAELIALQLLQYVVDLFSLPQFIGLKEFHSLWPFYE